MTQVRTFTTEQIIERLRLNNRSFYILKNAGKVPPPSYGLGVRKRYTIEQMEQIKVSLDRMARGEGC